MIFSTLANTIWAATFVGQAALLCVLLWRHRTRYLPIFTAYIIYSLLITILLFAISKAGGKHAYLLAYWITGFGDYALQAAVIFEIARIVLRPTGTWVIDARRSFLLWSIVGLAIALAVSFGLGEPGMKGLDLWDERITLFTSLLTCELFVAVSFAANRLGLHWRTHVMAIGEGLTGWALISLAGNVLHVTFGWNHNFVLYESIHQFAYLGALLFWIVSLWLPEKARAPLSPAMQDYLIELHRRVQYDLGRLQGTE